LNPLAASSGTAPVPTEESPTSLAPSQTDTPLQRAVTATPSVAKGDGPGDRPDASSDAPSPSPPISAGTVADTEAQSLGTIAPSEQPPINRQPQGAEGKSLDSPAEAAVFASEADDVDFPQGDTQLPSPTDAPPLPEAEPPEETAINREGTQIDAAPPTSLADAPSPMEPVETASASPVLAREPAPPAVASDAPLASPAVPGEMGNAATVEPPETEGGTDRSEGQDIPEPPEPPPALASGEVASAERPLAQRDGIAAPEMGISPSATEPLGSGEDLAAIAEDSVAEGSVTPTPSSSTLARQPEPASTLSSEPAAASNDSRLVEGATTAPNPALTDPIDPSGPRADFSDRPGAQQSFGESSPPIRTAAADLQPAPDITGEGIGTPDRGAPTDALTHPAGSDLAPDSVEPSVFSPDQPYVFPPAIQTSGETRADGATVPREQPSTLADGSEPAAPAARPDLPVDGSPPPAEDVPVADISGVSTIDDVSESAAAAARLDLLTDGSPPPTEDRSPATTSDINREFLPPTAAAAPTASPPGLPADTVDEGMTQPRDDATPAEGVNAPAARLDVADPTDLPPLAQETPAPATAATDPVAPPEILPEVPEVQAQAMPPQPGPPPATAVDPIASPLPPERTEASGDS
jgi:hypothetical protein